MSYKNITVEEFTKLMESENHQVLDVRFPEELVEGTIPGYVHINIFDPNFMSEVSKLDKSKTYLVYCRSGNRSAQACAVMGNLGFNNLNNLIGGIGAWNHSNMTV